MTMLYPLDVRYNPNVYACDGTGCDLEATFQSRYVMDSWNHPGLDLNAHGNFCFDCLYKYAPGKYEGSLLWHKRQL